MDEIHIIASWLRQREEEPDEAWIERLSCVFRADQDLSEDAETDRLGERLWKRFEARIKATNNGD